MSERPAAQGLGVNAGLTVFSAVMTGMLFGSGDTERASILSLGVVSVAAVTVLQYMAVASARPHPTISAFWERWYPALKMLPAPSMMSAITVPKIVAHREWLQTDDWITAALLAGMLFSWGLVFVSTIRQSPATR